MDRPQRKGPDYLARLGAATHAVVAQYCLTSDAVDALSALARLCEIDVEVRTVLPLTDRMHLCGALTRTARAVEAGTATPDEEAALRQAVKVLTGS